MGYIPPAIMPCLVVPVVSDRLEAVRRVEVYIHVVLGQGAGKAEYGARKNRRAYPPV